MKKQNLKYLINKINKELIINNKFKVHYLNK